MNRCPCPNCNDLLDEGRAAFDVVPAQRYLPPGVQRTADPHVLGEGPHGARKPHEPSRMRTGFVAAYWREPKSDDELEDWLFEREPVRDRANYEEKPEPARESRPLTEAERDKALEVLQSRPVARRYRDPGGDRWNWQAEVWAELVHPHAKVERVADIETRIARAIDRAEKRLRTQQREVPLPESMFRLLYGDRDDDFRARSVPFSCGG